VFPRFTDVENRIVHILLAVPAIHRNRFSLTISAKLNKLGEKRVEEPRISNHPSASNSGSDAGESALARRAGVDAEEQRQPVEDLV